MPLYRYDCLISLLLLYVCVAFQSRSSGSVVSDVCLTVALPLVLVFRFSVPLIGFVASHSLLFIVYLGRQLARLARSVFLCIQLFA